MTLVTMKVAPMLCSLLLVLVVLSCAIHEVVSFIPSNSKTVLYHRQSSHSVLGFLGATSTPTEEKDGGRGEGASSIPVVVVEGVEVVEVEEEFLSDLDARVLQSMLQDGALDLDTEEDMVKLLERGIAPKKTSTPQRDDESDSEYASRVISSLTDTKLWKALQAKADDVFESASIYVSNRIERDTKLLASIGIFAWDRAVRDVARALPAAGTSRVGRAVRTASKQLGTSSSFADVQDAIKASAASAIKDEERTLEDVNLYEEFNTPLDEIRSVTKSIRNILSGDTTTQQQQQQRGLRSTAPAGEKTRTERQQRAYQKRKQGVLKREKEGINVGRVTGGFVDAAWEVKQEIQVETNRPGYKTKGVRTALAAGAETTSRVIAAAREGQSGGWKNILFGSKEQEQVFELESEIESAAVPLMEMPDLPELPEIPSKPIMIAEVPLPVELLDEQRSVVSRLKFCIEMPEETWLTPDVLSSLEESLDPDSLREVVTTMICARDDLSVTSGQGSGTISELVTKLKQVKNTVEMVNSMASASAGAAVATKLSSILYGSSPDDEIRPTLMALDEIKALYERDLMARGVAQASYDLAIAERESIIAEWERIFDEREDIIEKAKVIAEQNFLEEARAEEARAEEELRAANVEWAVAAERAAAAQQQSAVANESQMDQTQSGSSVRDAVVVDAFDVSFEKSSSANAPQYSSSSSKKVEVIVDDDNNFRSTVSEVVSDTDFGEDDGDFGGDMYRTVLEEGEGTEEEPNILVDGTLRALDFVFVVTEKVIFIGVPGIFNAAGTASKRMDGASRGGLGKIGWSRLLNTERGAKRY